MISPISKSVFSVSLIAKVSSAAAALVLAGCVETVDGSLDTGAGYDSGSGTVSGNIRERVDGTHLFTLSRDGQACTAVYHDAAVPRGTELATLNCTDGRNGTATVVYGADAMPDRVVYAVNGAGGGTINF